MQVRDHLKGLPSFESNEIKVVQDGFGLSYSILDDSIVWTVTSSRRDTDEFAQCLRKAALDVQAFMERCLKAGLEPTPDVPSSKPKL